MSRIQRTTAVVAVAIVAGALSAAPVARLVARHLAVADGPWITFIGTGRDSADPYTRAAVALAGLYAMSSREAVYYTAFRDGHDRPLRGRCSYRLEGTAPPARWWSITLYGADSYLVANAAHRYAWDATTLPADADGRYRITVSATPQPEHWLPAPAQGSFSLTLRLYGPADAVRRDPAHVALPGIQRVACR